MTCKNLSDSKEPTMFLYAITFVETCGSFHSSYDRLVYAADEKGARAWAQKYAESLYDEYDGFDEDRQEWTYQDGDYALSIDQIERTTREAWMNAMYESALVK